MSYYRICMPLAPCEHTPHFAWRDHARHAKCPFAGVRLQVACTPCSDSLARFGCMHTPHVVGFAVSSSHFGCAARRPVAPCEQYLSVVL